MFLLLCYCVQLKFGHLVFLKFYGLFYIVFIFYDVKYLEAFNSSFSQFVERIFIAWILSSLIPCRLFISYNFLILPGKPFQVPLTAF